MNCKRKKQVLSVFLFLVDIVALFTCVELFFVFSSLLLFICVEKDFEKHEWLLLFVFDLILMFTILIENNRFEFLPQAYALLRGNSNLMYWFYKGNMHASRLLVAYPGYLFSCAGKIELNQGFTVYVGLIFELLYIYILRILKVYIKEIWTSGFVIGGFLLVLSFVMNGRIIFAYLGLQLIVYEDVCALKNVQNKRFLKWVRKGIGFVFTTVSSGTMVLTAAYICLMFIIRYLSRTSITNKIKALLLLLWIFILAIPLWSKLIEYIFKMIDKNISFFGGGIAGVVNMIQHGMGKLLYISDSSFYFIYFVILAGVSYINVLLFKQLIIKKYWEQLPLFLAVNLGVYGFAVGLSTGTMMLIPMVLVALIQANQCKI